MADVGALIVRIAADASELHKEFSKVGSSGKDLGEALGLSGKTIALGLAAAASAAVVLVKQIGEQAEATGRLAQITGLSTQRVQEWDAVFRRAGGSAQDLVQSTRTLSLQIVAAAEGSEEARRSFGRLGLETSKLSKDATTAFTAVIEKLAAMPPGFERTAVASQLLGRGMAQLLPAFAQGREEFARLIKEAHEFGAVLSGPQLEALQKADDAFDRLALATGGFAKQLAAVLAPAVTMIINDLATLTAKATQVFGLFSPPTAFEDARKELERFREELKLTDADLDKMAIGIQLVGQGAAVEQLAPAALAAEAAKAQAALGGAAAVKWDRESLNLYIQGLVSMGQEAQAAKQKQLQALAEVETQQRALREAEAHSLMMAVRRKDAAAQLEMDLNKELEESARQRFETEQIAAGKAEEAMGAFIRDRAVREFQAGEQIKGFWEQQLQGLQQSNAVSLGLIVSTWTSGIAQMIVKGGDLKAAWEATQIAIVQGLLNTTVQWVGQEALRVGATMGTNTTIVASSAATAGTMTTIFGGAGAAIVGMFQAVAGAVGSLAAGMFGILTSLGTFIVQTLIAIGEALTSTGFLTAVGIALLVTAATLAAKLASEGQAFGAVLAGVAAFAIGGSMLASFLSLEAAAGTVAGTSFADVGFFPTQEGGIFRGPTPAYLAEAGSPELALPLNERGQAFMEKLGFGGGHRPQTLIVELDSRVIGRKVLPVMPNLVRLKTGLSA